MRCKECGEGIYEGDEYYDTGSGGICKDKMGEYNKLVTVISR